ncbi:hypothetical protein, partial [Mesorhizobium sp.]|uniref:hypothetical protein n=1 Tax=Mesorhizobium sp. TaxID=1871066 RepID=UPI0025C448B4
DRAFRRFRETVKRTKATPGASRCSAGILRSARFGRFVPAGPILRTGLGPCRGGDFSLKRVMPRHQKRLGVSHGRAKGFHPRHINGGI